MSTEHSAPGRLVPDLDDELVSVFDQVEEVLLTLRAWESDPDQPAVLPTALAGGRALRAVHRVQRQLNPTQTRTSHTGRPLPAASGPARLLGPDRRYEHRPLRLVALDQTDLDVLNAAAEAMGRALATAPEGDLAEALSAGAEAAGSSGPGAAPDPVEIVTGLARALGVLDLAITPDTTLLISRLIGVEPDTDVVLTRAEDAAYARLASRINTMWTNAAGLDHFLY